jgi:hypothetical protein
MTILTEIGKLKAGMKILIDQYIKEGKNIICPTNSYGMSVDLAEHIRVYHPGVTVLLQNKDSEIVDTKEWKNFQVVIFSPTIVAGHSFNEIHFDHLVSYMTSHSCSALFCAQMLFRSRNLTTGSMDIFVNSNCDDTDMTDEEREEHVAAMYKGSYYLKMKSGLEVNNFTGDVIKDNYYQSYMLYLQEIEESRRNLGGVLAGILEAHGVETVLDNNYFLGDTISEESFTARALLSAQDTRAFIDKAHFKKALLVASAKDIDLEEFEKIDKLFKKTPEEQSKMDRFKLKSVVGEDVLITPILAFDLKQYQTQNKIRNLDRLYSDGFEMDTEERVIESNIISEAATSSIEQLHKSKVDPKLLLAHRILKTMKIKMKTVEEDSQAVMKSEDIPYSDLRDLYIQNEKTLDAFYKRDYKVEKKWSDYDPTESHDKQSILKYGNAIINEMFGLTLSMKGKSKKTKYLKGFEILTKHKIVIPVPRLQHSNSEMPVTSFVQTILDEEHTSI